MWSQGYAPSGMRLISIWTVLWIAVGLVVAANHGFISQPNTAASLFSAVLAVLAWPLVLINIHFGV